MTSYSRKVVLCVDDSQSTHSTWEYYMDAIANFKDELWIVTVFNPLPMSTAMLYTGAFIIPDDYEIEQSKEVLKLKKMLLQFVECVKNHNNFDKLKLAVDIKLLQAVDMEVGNVILAFAKDIQADCIIVGSRRLSRLKKIFLGSTSSFLLHHSEGIPIIVGPNKIVKDKPATSK